MAITFVQANSSGGNNTAPSHTLGTAPTQGNLLVAFVANDSGASQTAANGYTQLTVVTNTDVAALYYKIAGASEPATQQPCTLSASRGWNCHVAEYSLSSGSWMLDVEAAAADNAGAVKSSPSVTPAQGVEALLIGAAMELQAVNGPWSNQNFSGTAATERTDRSTNSVTSTLFDLVVSATSGSYVANATAAQANNGSGHIAVFRRLQPPLFPLLGVG
jgi:hypothetical protein